jgi:hypothetical protein
MAYPGEPKRHISPVAAKHWPSAVPAIAGANGRKSVTRRCIMKALFTALALITLITGASFAQHAESEAPTNQSPASSSYGDNGW